MQRYGLVDTSEIKRKERKSQWANRYNDRLPQSTLDGQPYEEGQDRSSSIDLSAEGDGARPHRQPNGDLWRPEDENYYNPEGENGSSGRWRYPANFDDAVVPSASKRGKKKKEKKDRWERTQDAYSLSEENSRPKKSKKKKSKSIATNSVASRESENSYPEDAEGGLYGTSSREPVDPSAKDASATTNEVFNHEF